MRECNFDIDEPYEPYIELDGGFARCERCNTEVEPYHQKCPDCGQSLDWSWFTNDK